MSIAIINIIAETNNYIVVEKIAGINVERWEGFASMEQMVFDYLQAKNTKKAPFVGVVHRLDRAVSGVLVMAKKKSALKDLNQQFETRKVEKKYFALVENRPLKDSNHLSHHLLVDKKAKKAFIFDEAKKDTQPCRLSYTFKKQVSDYFLIDINLETGKFHQIRAQLAHIGCPIVGDEKYGAKQFWKKDCIALHAHQLSFNEVFTEEKIIFSSAYDFTVKHI
jgi:23S rRNA pseudouridine1911/1915/1917 synthase